MYFQGRLPGGKGSFIFGGKNSSQVVRCNVKSNSGQLLTTFQTESAQFPVDEAESKKIQKILGLNAADLPWSLNLWNPMGTV